VQSGVGVEAAVVNKRRLARTVVVAQCQSREMNVKEEQRVAIKFCCKADISASKTVELMRKAYGDAAVCIYGTRRFITAFTRARHLSQIDPVHAPPSNLSQVHFNIILPSTSPLHSRINFKQSESK
jgi:hypothetical protein